MLLMLVQHLIVSFERKLRTAIEHDETIWRIVWKSEIKIILKKSTHVVIVNAIFNFRQVPFNDRSILFFLADSGLVL